MALSGKKRVGKGRGEERRRKSGDGGQERRWGWGAFLVEINVLYIFSCNLANLL
jgi:hypothetical protein